MSRHPNTAMSNWLIDRATGRVAVCAPTEIAQELERAGFVVMDDTRFPQETARGRAPRVWYVAHSTVK